MCPRLFVADGEALCSQDFCPGHFATAWVAPDPRFVDDTPQVALRVWQYTLPSSGQTSHLGGEQEACVQRKEAIPLSKLNNFQPLVSTAIRPEPLCRNSTKPTQFPKTQTGQQPRQLTPGFVPRFYQLGFLVRPKRGDYYRMQLECGLHEQGSICMPGISASCPCYFNTLQPGNFKLAGHHPSSVTSAHLNSGH